MTRCHQKAAASHPRAETGVFPLRAHLKLCSQQFYASALQPLHPSHLIVTSPPNPCPFRATLQASYHHTLRGLRVRGDDHNAPPHLRGCAGRGRLPLARHLLQGRMIEETIRSQAPNKVLHPSHHFISPVVRGSSPPSTNQQKPHDWNFNLKKG